MTAPIPAPREPDLRAFARAVRFRDRAAAAAVEHHERAGLAPSQTYARATFDAIEQMIREDERKKLADAGRLLPPDADTRTVHAVRMTWDDGTVTEDECERSLAEARVRFHAERRSVKPEWRVIKAEVIERTWRASSWLPVPTTGETP